MKKIILEILLGIGLPAAIFHTQLTGMFTPAKPLDRQVSIAVSRDSSYNAPAYNKTLVTVQVYVFTVKNHRQHIVWHRVYDTMPAKNYPLVHSNHQQIVNVKNVQDGKEQLYITYIITYKTNGCIMQIENGTKLLKGERSILVGINI